MPHVDDRHMRILRPLARAEQALDALADQLGMSPDALRAELAELEAAGLVTRVTTGGGERYALTDAGREALRQGGQA